MRLLWVKTDLLHPLSRGGRIRTYGILRELRREHDVTYVTIDPDPTAARLRKAQEYAHRVELVAHRLAARGGARWALTLGRNLFSRYPLAVARYRSPFLGRRVCQLAEGRSCDLIVCDFLVTWASLSGVSGLPPLVLFQHNVETRIWERQAQASPDGLRRWFFTLQARRMRRLEATALREVARVIAVSPEDERTFREEFGAQRVSRVETGVDVEFFRGADAWPEEPDHVVFTGSMDWMPNEAGVAWFLREAWPRIRARRPTSRFTIVGRRPSVALRRLAREYAGVAVTGDVADVRPYLGAASVVVVPLRVGSGTRLKVYEALAAGKAVVSTGIGAEGLSVRDGEHLVLADTPETFAAAVLGLLDAPARRLALARSGRALVARRFSWGVVADQFADICRQVLDPAGRRVAMA